MKSFEHYSVAEELLAVSGQFMETHQTYAQLLIAKAHVHAVLAGVGPEPTDTSTLELMCDYKKPHNFHNWESTTGHTWLCRGIQ